MPNAITPPADLVAAPLTRTDIARIWRRVMGGLMTPGEEEFAREIERATAAALASPAPAAQAEPVCVPREWRSALRKLALMARTGGGTAGPDSGLMAACAEAEALLALPYLHAQPAGNASAKTVAWHIHFPGCDGSADWAELGAAAPDLQGWTGAVAKPMVYAGDVGAVPADEQRPTRADLIAALQFYASGEHFALSVQDAWDTVSGEPQNWWCDEAGTATVEDGHIAKATLAGELTADQINADD